MHSHWTLAFLSVGIDDLLKLVCLIEWSYLIVMAFFKSNLPFALTTLAM